MKNYGDTFSQWRADTLSRESAARRILGLGDDAGLREIRSAYIRLAFINHPDKNPGDKLADGRFTNLVNAYRTLACGASLRLSESLETMPRRPTPKNDPIDYLDMWRKRFA